MKKLTLFTLLAVAAVTAALSCAKQDADFAGTVKPLIIEVGAPVIETEPTTSVTLTNNVKPYTVEWEPGDKIMIFNHTVKESGYHAWDPFTTEDGGATASFSGTVGATGKDEYVAFSMYQDGVHEASLSASASSTLLHYYIPAQQDGTGAKYALYATRQVTYGGGTLTISNMTLRSALTRFTIAGDAIVKRITVTVKYKDGDDDVNVVSNLCGLCSGTEGTKPMPIFSFKEAGKATFTQGQGGTGSTITIENGGARLLGDIYFASRHTLKTYSKCTLEFVFTNNLDQTCTKRVTLSEAKDTGYQIQNGVMNIMRTVTLNEGDFSS